MERILARRKGSYHLPFAEARADRLEEYAAALDLSAEEVLGGYEESDPWLCATILDPAAAPLIRRLLALTEEQKQQLNTTGSLALRLSQQDENLQQHMARWAAGEWNWLGTWVPLDPDRFIQFATHEERMASAVIWYWWHSMGLKAELCVPDEGRSFLDVVALDTGSMPHQWRSKLIMLGYRKRTPAYQQFIDEDQSRWEQEHPVAAREGAGYAFRSEVPNYADPHLELEVDLDDLQDRSVPGFLEHIARVHALSIVSGYLPPDLCIVAPPWDMVQGVQVEWPTMGTLGEILRWLRQARDGCVTWRFRGDHLVIRDVELDYLSAGRLPEQLARQWEELNAAGKQVALDDLASLLAATNMAQIEALASGPSAIHRVYLALQLRAYGLLDAEQRAQLGRPDGLPCSELRQDQRPAVLRAVRGDHLWVTAADLDGAVLRTIPRTLSSGEEGISFIVEIERPGGGVDRLGLFAFPLQVQLGQ